MLAKTVYGEARGCAQAEQRLVIWTVLQRVDSDLYPNRIKAVLTARNQFYGYRASNPVWDDIYALCLEEVEKWQSGAIPPVNSAYAPTLPYYYFSGDGKHNYFHE